MSKIIIPAPPQPMFSGVVGGSGQTQAQRLLPQPHLTASKPLAPLDAAFLSRAYGTILWFGTLLALCVYTLTLSTLITGSFAGGALVAALLLKSQELWAGRIMRPDSKLARRGGDARFLLVGLLAVKCVLLGIVFAFLLHFHLLHPIGFTAGFMAAQIALIAKIFGYMIAQQMRPLHETNNVYEKQGRADVA